MKVWKKHEAEKVEIRIFLTPSEAETLYKRLGEENLVPANPPLARDFMYALISSLVPSKPPSPE